VTRSTHDWNGKDVTRFLVQIFV